MRRDFAGTYPPEVKAQRFPWNIVTTSDTGDVYHEASYSVIRVIHKLSDVPTDLEECPQQRAHDI